MSLTTALFTTKRKVVNALPPIDISGGKTTDVISMKGYDRATFIVTFGVVNDGATPGALTIKKCTDVSATGATAMPFTYRVESDAAGDTLDSISSATSTGVNLSSVLSTEDNVMLIAEVRAEELTSGTTTNYDCLRLDIAYSSDSAIASVVCILDGARYQNDSMPSAITD